MARRRLIIEEEFTFDEEIDKEKDEKIDTIVLPTLFKFGANTRLLVWQIEYNTKGLIITKWGDFEDYKNGRFSHKTTK